MPTPIALGASIDGADADPSEIDNYTLLCNGAAPNIVLWYQDWPDQFNLGLANDIISRGATPIMTWQPHLHTLADIGNGVHDTYIKSFATKVAMVGQPVGIRFAHEMNGHWYPWGVGLPGNSATLYIKAWHHIHTIFQQKNATNALWIWSPNCEGSSPLTISYPGNTYVDYVGIDGYSWGPPLPGQPMGGGPDWRFFNQIFHQSYAQITQLTNKPVIIAETACSSNGGDKKLWIENAFNVIPTNYPSVRGVIWFHYDKERDWRIDSTPAARLAFAKIANSAEYSGHL